MIHFVARFYFRNKVFYFVVILYAMCYCIDTEYDLKISTINI